MASNHPQGDRRQDRVQSDPQDTPEAPMSGTTTEEGDTPLDERQRMTGQAAETEARSGAETEAPGGDAKVTGSPNQGTESR